MNLAMWRVENIAFRVSGLEGQLDRLPGLAAELVRLKVDVIVTLSRPALAGSERRNT